MIILWIISTLIEASLQQFQLDNAIIGTPKIECNPDSITFSFNTRNPFRGSVYIRGFYDRASCRKRYDVMSAQGGFLSVRLGDCGMTRMRQLVPRGVSVHATFVANFHQVFATKEDRAFDVRCFYAHSDSLVKADIDVNGVPAESLEQATTVVPKCEYSLREGSLDGPRVRTVTVGAPIFHRWDCDTNGNYGILVRSCSIVDTRLSESVPFLDDSGCAISREFPQVVYSTSLTSAYTVIEAISFPDQPAISFACQIQLCDRTADECRGISPPLCNNQQAPMQTIIVDNNLSPMDLEGVSEEPWMKEPSPFDDNETLIVFTDPTPIESTPMPRLTTIAENEDDWMVESNHVDKETRLKRSIKEKVFDVASHELFVAPLTVSEALRMERRSPCVTENILYAVSAALVLIFVLSIGIVVFFGGHFAKKRKELMDKQSSVVYYSGQF